MRRSPAASTSACCQAGIPAPEPRTMDGQVRGRRRRSSPGRSPGPTWTMPTRSSTRSGSGRWWPRCTTSPPAPDPCWFEAPVGAREWRAVLKAARGAGAPYAGRLAEILPGLLEVEEILTPMAPRQLCHLDLWADNVRRSAGGGLCVFDFDNAGAGDPAARWRWSSSSSAGGDAGRQRLSATTPTATPAAGTDRRSRGLRDDRRPAPPHRTSSSADVAGGPGQ